MAVRLAEHILADPKRRKAGVRLPRQVVVFAVNVIPLVFQQGRVFQDQTTLRVGMFCGEAISKEVLNSMICFACSFLFHSLLLLFLLLYPL